MYESEMKPGLLHERCLVEKGCEKADREQGVCTVYTNPSRWWGLGGCPMATHWKAGQEDIGKKVRVGQQKQGKKGKKKKA